VDEAMMHPPAPESRSTLLHGNLEIRLDEIQVLADGRRVGLTVREFQVFQVLAEREDRVVRRAEIYGRVWGGGMKRRDRSVDVFVRKVRNKLSQASPGWVYIHTHFGVGYRFAASPAIDVDTVDEDPDGINRRLRKQAPEDSTRAGRDATATRGQDNSRSTGPLAGDQRTGR
jgi:DNA-binding winged helix-turn-helix (wHTH) protein